MNKVYLIQDYIKKGEDYNTELNIGMMVEGYNNELNVWVMLECYNTELSVGVLLE